MRKIEPNTKSPYWLLANQILDEIFKARIEGIRDGIEAPGIRWHQINFIIDVLNRLTIQEGDPGYVYIPIDKKLAQDLNRLTPNAKDKVERTIREYLSTVPDDYLTPEKKEIKLTP